MNADYQGNRGQIDVGVSGGGNNTTLIVGIVVCILVLVGVGVGAYFLFFKNKTTSPEEVTDTKVPSKTPKTKKAAKKVKTKKVKTKKAKTKKAKKSKTKKARRTKKGLSEPSIPGPEEPATTIPGPEPATTTPLRKKTNRQPRKITGAIPQSDTSGTCDEPMVFHDGTCKPCDQVQKGSVKTPGENLCKASSGGNDVPPAKTPTPPAKTPTNSPPVPKPTPKKTPKPPAKTPTNSAPVPNPTPKKTPKPPTSTPTKNPPTSKCTGGPADLAAWSTPFFDSVTGKHYCCRNSSGSSCLLCDNYDGSKCDRNSNANLDPNWAVPTTSCEDQGGGLKLFPQFTVNVDGAVVEDPSRPKHCTTQAGQDDYIKNLQKVKLRTDAFKKMLGDIPDMAKKLAKGDYDGFWKDVKAGVGPTVQAIGKDVGDFVRDFPDAAKQIAAAFVKP